MENIVLIMWKHKYSNILNYTSVQFGCHILALPVGNYVSVFTVVCNHFIPFTIYITLSLMISPVLKYRTLFTHLS